MRSLVVVVMLLGCGRLDLDALGSDRPPGDGGAGAGGPLPLNLELIAGDIGGSGNADGTGATARFNRPISVAVDGAGNVYVVDEFSFTIRKVTAGGVVTTLAGTTNASGSTDATGAAARFSQPLGAAVDGAGNVYIADYGNATIRKITPAGAVTTLAGNPGVRGNVDGSRAAALFVSPSSVAVDSAGNVYVADQGNQNIRKITPAGVVTTLAGAGGSGSADGTGAAAQFFNPSGVAVDGAGNVYVADTGNATIRKVTPAGAVTTLAGTAGMFSAADGTGAAARFSGPSGVAVDSAGNIYVADTGNATIRKVTPTGAVTTLAGTAGVSGAVDGIGAAAQFALPSGVTVDRADNVYVADAAYSLIRKITASGAVTTLAGAPGLVGSVDGTGTAARFNGPAGVAVDGAGNIYVSDQGNSDLRKITLAGAVTTLAGTAGMSGGTDGTGATARFDDPVGVATDGAGNVYVADNGNCTIRKITPAGVVTTLAGIQGTQGGADGPGATAGFAFPRGVAADRSGNVYVADYDNAAIRKITAGGVVTTLAGGGAATSGDGTGAAAGFNEPTDVAVDSAGNVYVADRDNFTIRKITPAGAVTTLAGTTGMSGSADGTGAAARFGLPVSLAVDSASNVYVADARNATIRKVSPAGVVTTVAGMAGVSGVALGATPQFSAPVAVAIVGDSLVISDANAVLLLRHGAR